jgi:periplasmic divalent cation tolerance protein
LFKTMPQLAEQLRDRIEALHPYDLPVVEAWPAGANDKVSGWIAAETD